MLKSMTAYGRASLATPLGHFSVEISSVNRRYLEVNNSLPPELLCFDAEIKKWISRKISRGTVSVKLAGEFTKGSIVSIKPNLLLARQLKSAWEEIANDLELPPEKGFKLEMLSSIEQMILFENHADAEESLPGIIHEVVHKALEQLIVMKEKEGAVLWEDISARLEEIREAVLAITELAPEAAKRFHARLRERLQEISLNNSENEERLMRELCIYAEKADVSEELVRLKSHLEQFVELMDNATNRNVGKTLDFLLQEMNREINTIASKASELKISQGVIAVKSELERIREQIQNVE